MNTKLTAILAAIGLVAAAGNALAQEDTYRAPWRGDFWGYVGASGGESKFQTSCSSLNVFRCESRDTGWKVYAGGNINRIFGLEAGYTDFGKIAASGGDTKAWAANVSLTAGVPIGDRFAIFAKGGGIYGRTDISADPASRFTKSPACWKTIRPSGMTNVSRPCAMPDSWRSSSRAARTVPERGRLVTTARSGCTRSCSAIRSARVWIWLARVRSTAT